MKQKNNIKARRNYNYLLVILIMSFLFVQSGCNKNEAPEFTPGFSYSFIDDNHVKFVNTSSGEYYFMTWDFGNGITETTTDQKESFTIYYPLAGTYDVSLRLTNYYGENETQTQTINIAQNDLSVSVSFTAEIDPDNPNIVILTNTSTGQYDSFKWKYRNLEVENQKIHEAYFPFAGDYKIELIVSKGDLDFSDTQMVSITQDDPDYDPTLIWSDEFNYTGLPDPAKWNMETGGGGWGNNELQYYTDSESNAMVDNGVLTITAREETVSGYNYTSARITTQNKFDFKYGRIEAKMKLPYGQGMWPAFWMLGANFGSVGWPACGEIDIMEMVGGVNGDKTVYSTLHWDNNGENADYGESYTLSSGIFADEFHIFSVVWDNQQIRAYVDNVQFFSSDITPVALSEFQNNFFIIMNLAVGGNWPGPPDGTTEFPQTLVVDWVRVYQD
ncbi:MAG TPA: family 16 glycosylhydrolase [Bacteroidales bacterium]